MEPLQPLQPKPLAAKKERPVLAIALLAAVGVFLLTAGLGAWVYLQRVNNEAPAAAEIDKTETRNVTKVSWVAPTIPQDYTAVDEYAQDVQATAYTNATTGCTLISRVAPAEADVRRMIVKALDAPGYTTNSATTDKSVSFADADGTHEYEFKTLAVDQSVSIPEVQLTSQSGTVYYKQFGQHVASLVAVCKSSSEQATLATLAQQFKLITERQ